MSRCGSHSVTGLSSSGSRCRVRLLMMLALFLACAGGCASTRLEPLTSETEPVTLSEQERALWATADTIESQIAEHVGLSAGHEQAEQYLGEVLKKLTRDFDNPNVHVRIRVLPDPSPNAFILPNGAMYVNSGLLALLENEAQIATVLGHEFAHFGNRHSYRERIKEQNAFVRGALLGGALGVLSATPDMANSIAEICRISSVSGYSRDLESEADHSSLMAMMQAGYQPEQAIKAFEQLQSVSDPKEEENQRFATHPKLSERIDSYRRCLREPEIRQQATGELVADDVYNTRLFDVILDNARLNLEEENYPLAQANIDRCLKLKPDCARAHYLRGEFLRSAPVADEDPWRGAVESYERALHCDPNCIEAYREIGLLHRYLGDRDKAGQSLHEYVEQAGDAVDVSLVKGYIDGLPALGPAAKPYRAPEITHENLREKARTIGLVPVRMPDGVPSADKRKEEFENALVERLEQAGFAVVRSCAYKEIYESMKKAMGAIYDPNTGARLEGRHDVLAQHAFREYVSMHRIDAMAHPVIVVVNANWSMNRAYWHGVQESSTGKEGFWADMVAPSASGTMAALSFRVHISSVYGELCYLGFGGIQLCSRIVGGQFVDVPMHEILVNQTKNARSVELVCQTLLGETK